MSLRVHRKRSFTLIEVLISIFVLSLTLIPLLYPHFAIQREEQWFVREVELDRMANLLYAEDLRRYHSGEVELESEEVLSDPILGYQVTRTTSVVRSKPNDDPTVFLMETRYLFKMSKREQSFAYYVVLEKPAA